MNLDDAKRIDIISDTHGYLSPELLEQLQGADVIVHAGDICSVSDYHTLCDIAPVKLCLGNNDWSYDYGPMVKDRIVFLGGGLRWQATHYRRRLNLQMCDVAVFGHTHTPVLERDEWTGVLVMNPGSPTYPRRSRPSMGRVLVEECVEGMEITVPVIGNDEDAHALPIVEIVTGAEFYDLKVKYEPSSMHHVIPARLEPGVYVRAQELAERAHRALGCRGCSRSDFIVTEDGVPVILETNTIPGMTAESLLPDSARHGGIEFPELCTKFVELALEGAEKRG